jgi:hypothetical protein
MAIKITTQIGTDKGITSEAYLRIADYQVSKYGSANFRLEIYLSQEDTLNIVPMMMGGTARNQQIGDSFNVPMNKVVSETIKVKRTLPVEVTDQVPGPIGEDGKKTFVDRVKMEFKEQDVEEVITKTVADMSSAEGIDIFQFGYTHLKEKLVGLFGAEHIVDC